MKMRLFFLLIALATAVACNDDPCNDPFAFNYDPQGTSDENCIYEPTQLEIQIKTTFGGVPMDTGAMFKTQDGRDVRVNRFELFISELTMLADTIYMPVSHDIVLVESNPVAPHVAFISSKDELKGIRFVIGVDSAAYNVDPTTAAPNSPLSQSDMWWSWSSGYRYIVIEGLVDTSSTKDGSGLTEFAYHVGLEPNLRELEFHDHVFKRVGNKVFVEFKIEVSQLMSNLDFTNERFTHSNDYPELAKKIADEVPNAISVE